MPILAAALWLGSYLLTPQAAFADPTPGPEQVETLAVELASCDPSGSPTSADATNAAILNDRLQAKLAGAMTAYRVSCARVIVQTVQNRGLHQRAAVIAITTAIVESGLWNYATAVDHDSLGLFQQRPSQGWGTPSQLIDPVYATNAFLNKMLQLYPNNTWLTAPIGEICQEVQRSAFPERYQPQAGDAQIIVDLLWYTPPPPPKLAPAVLKSTSDGRATTYRWSSTGDEFRRATDWISSSTYTVDLVGDRLGAGDVNRDSKDDIVAAKQNPDGTFVIQVWLAGVQSPQTWYQSEGGTNLNATVAGRLVVGDWNGDGDAEPAMLKSTTDGRATIYRWTSTGNAFQRITDWTSVSTYTLDLVGDRVAAGDVNGDGKDDIVAAKQNPDGTFVIQTWLDGVDAPQTWYQSDGNTNLEVSVAGRFVVGDWNGNGKAEPAFVKSTSDGRAAIYRWTSTGDSFQRATDWVSEGTYTLDLVGDRVAAGDVDGDRRDDIVAAKQNPDGTFTIQVWLNGVNAPQTWYQSDGNTSLNATVAGRLVLGDWNGNE